MIPNVVLNWSNEYPDFKYLKAQCMDVYAANNKFNQCMLQTADPEKNDWEHGVGQTILYENFNPRTICHIQPSLKDTEIEKFFKWLEVPVWRTRLMMAPVKSVYSLHAGGDFRLHLPIYTNDNCYFLFPESHPKAEMWHMPANGRVHWANTRRVHTMMNASLTEGRLHMVMCADILINI